MRSPRRFSQAISEGDGISLLADVDDSAAARHAEGAGAEGIVVRVGVSGLREATELPILWYPHAAHEDAADAGADACIVAVAGLESEDGELERVYADAVERGLDPVVAVHDEDQLQLALDRLDPEIVLLRGGRDDEGLEHVLGLLPDVPAGKLAVAELELSTRDEVEELERAGVDAVIVRSVDVSQLIGEPAPQP